MVKKRRGHYCKVCSRVLPNEKFSGKGHSRHICKKCSKKSPEERNVQIKINNIYNMTRFRNLSRDNKGKLQKYLKDDSKRVREAAKSVIDEYEEYERMRRLERELEDKNASMTKEEYEEFFKEAENYQDDFDGEDIGIPF